MKKRLVNKLKKRGMSHVEMVISFIIFVVAVSFSLYFFSPLDSTRLVESTLLYGFNEINDNVSIELEIFSVIINNTKIVRDVNLNSLSTPPILSVDLEESFNLNVMVKTQDGDELIARVFNDIVYVDLGNDWASVDFVEIILGDEFETRNFQSVGALGIDYYNIVSRNTEKVISEKKFKNLKSFYDGNYLDLKTDFNIPNRVNIGFSLVFSRNSQDLIKASSNIPRGLEIFSETKREKVLRDNASKDFEFADLTVEVW